MTVSAGANDQAVVTFTTAISVTDDDNNDNFSCTANNGATLTPPNIITTGTQLTGGTFKLGTTTIACVAPDDPAEPECEKGAVSFTVTVNDQPLSFANVPSTITVDATSPAGATVTYTAPTAFEDSESESIPVTCLPASGSVFAITPPGNFITVTCTANEADSGSSTATFLVHVEGAAEQITDLIAVVDSIPGAKQSFEDQLQTALTDLNAGNIAQACGDLTGFINHVMAQSGKQLTVSQANQLIAAAKQIRAVLGCK